MIGVEQARRIVEEQMSDDVGIIKVEEHEFGWIFFYQSRAFIASGDMRDSLVGNAPYIVNRDTGAVWRGGTSGGMKGLLERYRKFLAERPSGAPRDT